MGQKQTQLILTALTQAMGWTKNQLKLSYAKTYIGKTTKEFTFLGYRLKGASMLEVAPQTIAKSLVRVTLLLE